jgi:hypothetical protein
MMANGRPHKVLFVHAGGTKTGTSALQNFLEIEKDEFRQFGLSYENAHGIRSMHEITSGNGHRIYVMLRDAESTDADLGRMLQSYFNGTSRAICSCEGFGELGPKAWTRLAQITVNLGIQLEVIFYVRDVMPFFWSGYDQAIKRHGEHRSFTQWAAQADWNHGLALKRITAEIPLHKIHVLHYEEGRRSIFEGFLHVFEIDASFKVEPLYKDALVNRSLTKREREALKFANAILGDMYGRELSDLLIYSNPSAKSDPVFVCKRVKKQLLDRFQADVNWVNETFFNGTKAVAVLPPERPRGPGQSVAKSWNSNEQNVSDKLSYIWAINKLGAAKADVERLTMSQLNAVATRYSQHKHPDLPADFNVVAYLARNPDVLFSGVDPVQHYLLNGRSEGRLYKYGPANGLAVGAE